MSHMNYRSLLQNIVSFIGLFCKRDPLLYIYDMYGASTLDVHKHISTLYMTQHQLYV